MKPVSFKTQMTEGESFKVQIDDLPYFYDRLHFHPELQITLIEKGYGAFFISDRMVPFQAGEVLLIGSNVPHMWKCDRVFYEDETLGVAAISIHFNQVALGHRFFDLPELTAINQLFGKARRGIVLDGALREMASQVLQRIAKSEGFERLWLLLDLLHHISEREGEQRYLANIGFEMNDGREDERLNQVFQFVMDNYRRPLTLVEVAGVANLSVSAFCRYFKLRTRKTFIQFLNEIRISAACKHLREQVVSVAEIAYQVGFSNLSNFNRQFKNTMDCSPSQYLKKMEKEQ